ncbi:hypothetical protein RHMOL_Rhmol08G0235800 [Rhododendron molle]|uniref:Uncharacterized protein n=1 Tax=Rhododendron molle TaxID=49168 RepID=A0ACC0MSY6_RHOML|nr:hypothetical protein RHMOL_Rhmol08G0235800 [Rhododendron molle]
MSSKKKETRKSSKSSQSNPPNICAPNAAGICIPRIHMQQQQPSTTTPKPLPESPVPNKKDTAAKPAVAAAPREITIQ